MQMATVNTKKAYQQGLSELPRTASFIATSNRRDLLTDPTGSQRFICIEVDKKIDCSPIDHAQIYAQLKEEIEAGKRYWFEEDEEMKAVDKEAMKGVKESKVWGLLKDLDYHKEHYEDGNKYNIVRKLN